MSERTVQRTEQPLRPSWLVAWVTSALVQEAVVVTLAILHRPPWAASVGLLTGGLLAGQEAT